MQICTWIVSSKQIWINIILCLCFADLQFRSFRTLKFAVAGYSGVTIFAGEIFADIRSESVYHNSIRQLQRSKTCWTWFSAAYLAILAFWVSVMVLSYWSLFINPMAADPLCSAAATRVVLSTLLSVQPSPLMEEQSSLNLARCRTWVLSKVE